MRCPTCQAEHLPDSVFCDDCGARLDRACPACGADNRPTARYCRKCRTALASAEPPVAHGARDAASAAARKVVTIVFADLVGSTSLHERMDAESARALMDRYYRVLRAAVDAHRGTVVKLLGDGVMAAFGIPRVAEDDAIRAVRAGVAMQQAFRAFVKTLTPEDHLEGPFPQPVECVCWMRAPNRSQKGGLNGRSIWWNRSAF